MISFSCAKCGRAFKLKPEFAGRKTTCSGCKAPLAVPADATIAPPALPKIAFSCGNCGMKFNVPSEFAGRSSQCPTCKQPLKVPTVDETMAYTPPTGAIDGAPSSLARVGVEGGVTLGNTDDPTTRSTPLTDLLDGKKNAGGRYVLQHELARGGMGTVIFAADCDIRREVAIKFLLDQSSTQNKLRFVEEAQITGQLEHPNIVPIHELGVDADKRIFFSMKLVKGRSLQEMIKALRNDPGMEREYSQSRLLNIFINVCNALDYAHTRGVVHRDLKPANIMVGDFGEVYVMDWGLAKVLKREGVSATAPVMALPVAAIAPSGPFDFTPAPPLATAVPVATAAPAEDSGRSSGSKVVTSREADADLTQQGVVIGTPVYMPPEQAAGQIHDIDERSDIYSMGAILYEMLTLHAPIDRSGGITAIMLRVNQGQIAPPEQKAPERAKAGKIPPELAAIAMKALAKSKQDRYQSIAPLRQDIERFMDGRSVSAKPDTIREMTVKFVRRNRGVSIATAAASIILLVGAIWSFASILSANQRTQKAYDSYVAEQKEKQALARRSVPSLVRASKMLITENRIDDALNQVNIAIGFDDTDADARFVRAQLLLHKQEFEAARQDLEVCLKQKPAHDEAVRLLDIAKDPRPDKIGTLLALSKALIDQKVPQLAKPLTQRAQKLMGTKAEVLQVYQVRIEAAWPTYGTFLRVNNVGEFVLDLPMRLEVKDLEPLRGIPINHLTIQNSQQIKDIAPLKGMPLTTLALNSNSQISDLSPLQGARLTQLSLHSQKVSDLWPLKSMPLTYLDLANCPQIRDLSPLQGMQLTYLGMQNSTVAELTPLQGMPLTTLILRNNSNITDLAPLKGMPLTILEAEGARVSDVSPLRGMPLKKLFLTGTTNLRDLSALKGMPLTEVNLVQCSATDLSPLATSTLKFLALSIAPEITDLSPLRKTSLKQLNLNKCPKLERLSLEGLELAELHIDSCEKVSDLTPIKNAKLVNLSLSRIAVADLEPLRGMPLRSLKARCPNLTNLQPLTGMRLDWLDLDESAVEDLTPLAGMPLRTVLLGSCKKLKDLSPLAGMSIVGITIPIDATKVDAVRSMQSITSINGMAPAQFWKLWDAPKTKGK